MSPLNYNNWPSIFWRPFSGHLFSGHLTYRTTTVIQATSARAQKIFALRNMRPLSIREPPPPDWGYGGSFHRLCAQNCASVSDGSRTDNGSGLQLMMLLLMMINYGDR